MTLRGGGVLRAAGENFTGQARSSHELIGRVEAVDPPQWGVVDTNSAEIPVSGRQEQSACNGCSESTCYRPRLLLNREGGRLAAKLRSLNVHSVGPRVELLLPEIERQ